MWRVVRPAPQAAIGLALLAALVALAACAPQTQLRGPAIQAPQLAVDHLVMSDGARLPMRRWLPGSDVDAVVIALHGFTDYRNAFSDLGAYLARRGIATYAYDQRGFGGTARRGIWPGTSLLADDLIQVTELVRKLHPKANLFVLGESMGAAVVLIAMTHHDFPDISGAVLVAPAVWGWQVMNPALAGLLRLLAHSAPWLPIPASQFRKLASDNQAMLEALDQDPLVLQSVRVDALYGLVTLMDDALESTTSLRAPTLILYGARERVIPRAAGEEFIRRLPASQQVLIYPQGHHTLLRDRNAEVVLRDVARWIADVPMPRAGQVAAAETIQPFLTYPAAGRSRARCEAPRRLGVHNCACEGDADAPPATARAMVPALRSCDPAAGPEQIRGCATLSPSRVDERPVRNVLTSRH